MAAKKKTSRESKAANKTPEGTDKHWFPENAPAPAAPAAPKKASPWQRRVVHVNYGTLAKPGICLRTLFNEYVSEKYKRIKEDDRTQLWRTVGTRMLTEPTSRLKEIIDEVVAQKK